MNSYLDAKYTLLKLVLDYFNTYHVLLGGASFLEPPGVSMRAILMVQTVICSCQHLLSRLEGGKKAAMLPRAVQIIQSALIDTVHAYIRIRARLPPK
jgi:hypothetical protein